MRALTTTTESKATQALSTEPIIIVKIEWDSGDEYYSEKSFTLGDITAQGKIIDFNPVQALRKTDTVGEAASATLLLDDTDGTLKIILNTEIIEGTAVTVYQHFEGALEADLTILLAGKIAGGIGWSEGERTLDISIDSSVEDKEVGFAPDEDDIVDINPDAVDVPWPLCFGTVVHVPAVRVKREPVGHLTIGINQNFNTFRVSGGDLFPQHPTVVTIEIRKVLYTGTFDGDIFTVNSKNLTHHTNIFFLPRRVGDPHQFDPSVAWINYNINIVGLFCRALTNSGYTINYCIRQEGNKCYFIEPWGIHSGGQVKYVIVGAFGEKITETAGAVRSTWGYFILESQIGQWPIGQFGDIITIIEGATVIVPGRWKLPNGERVKLKVSYNDLYVCNLLPSVTILAVYGHRKSDDRTVFVPIPSSYYTKNLSDSLAGETPTTLEFEIPLEEHEDEGWDGDVFVTLRSSRGSNVVQNIQWLIETYSNLSVDATFAAIAIKVGAYPANFAVFDQPNVLKLIEEIVWQTRCALVIRNGIVSIIYLSEMTSAVATVDEDSLELKTLSLGFSDTDDIITKFIGNWLKDYSGEVESSRRVIYKNNIDIFNLVEDEREFFIYNNADLVKLSTFFWGYRYSNSWRKVAFKTFLDTLALEPFDTIEHDIAVLTTNPLRGIVEDTSQDSDEQSISLETELASKAGDSESGQPIEDQNYFLGDPSFPVDIWNNPIDVPDPGEGFEEINYFVPTDTVDDEGNDTDEESEPEEAKYFLKITAYPGAVERGVAFEFSVEAQDSLGVLVNEDVVASLSLDTTGADILSPASITLVGGEYRGNLTISGGAGWQTGIITIASSGYEPDQTASFDIVPVLSNLTAVGPIPDVPREVAQSSLKVVSGALNGEILNLQLNTSAGDKIYDSGDTEITTLTADGSGDFYLPNNWYIKGGQGNVPASIVFTDTAQLKYNSLSHANLDFNITGSTSIVVTQGIEFSHKNTANKSSLDLIPPLFISDSYAFELEVQVLDSNGDLDTSYNGDVAISVLDDAGNPLDGLVWLFAGDEYLDGNNIIVHVTSGRWFSDICGIKVPESETEIILSAVQSDLAITDEETIVVGDPFYSISLSAIEFIDRDTGYSMQVTARNPDGSVDTEYKPIKEPTITLSGGGGGESITPDVLPRIGWDAGVITIDFEISGGSGVDEITITVEEENRIGKSTITVLSTGAPATDILSPYSPRRYYLGNDSFQDGGMDPCNPVAVSKFAEIQNDAYVILQADTALQTASSPHLNYLLNDYSSFANMNVEMRIYRFRFAITAAQISNAKAAKIKLTCNGAYQKNHNTDLYSPYANKFRVVVDITDNLSKYGSGAAVIANAGVAEWNLAALVDQLILWGKSPTVDGDTIYLTIPVEIIQGFSGPLDFDIWVSLRPVVHFMSKPTPSWCTIVNQLRTVFNISHVYLYK